MTPLNRMARVGSDSKLKYCTLCSFNLCLFFYNYTDMVKVLVTLPQGPSLQKRGTRKNLSVHGIVQTPMRFCKVRL